MFAISLCERRASVSQILRECRAKFVRTRDELELEFANDSCDNRTIFVRLSQIGLKHPNSVT